MKLLHQGNHHFRFFQSTDLDYPLHLHNALEIVFLTGGSAHFLYGSRRIRLTAGDVFVCFPNQVHGYENSHDVQSYVMIIPMNHYLSAFQGIFGQKLPADPILPKGTWEHTAIPQLLPIAYEEREQISKQVMQGYLLLIVGKLLPLLTLHDAPAGSADVLQSVLLYLNDHYTQPISRKEIARAVGCNESYISHCFSVTLRTTLSEYIVSLRISDAQNALTNTALPVSQIAFSLGFGSLRSFNRVFRQYTGMTPTAYRKTSSESRLNK